MDLPEPGKQFQSKYHLHDVLGEGGFATVYRAEDVGAKRIVALKILKPIDGEYPPAIESRFQREVRVVASLRDPHTVTMFDFGRSDDGLLFMVFEYVPGSDLSQLITERGALTQSETVHILSQVLQSLREAHQAGLLHRDIKPENIRLSEYMGDPLRVTLLDFGIAKPVKPGSDMSAITHSGALVGTPRYMSPEQLLERELTPASDIYSLGLVAYEMLVGTPAIRGNQLSDQLRILAGAEILRLPYDAAVQPAMRRIVDRMISKDPTVRLQTAEQVLRTLASLHTPEPQDISLDETGALRPIGVSQSGGAPIRPVTGPQEVRPSTGPMHVTDSGPYPSSSDHIQVSAASPIAQPTASSAHYAPHTYGGQSTAPQPQPIPFRHGPMSSDSGIEQVAEEAENDSEIPTGMLIFAMVVLVVLVVAVVSKFASSLLPSQTHQPVPALPPSMLVVAEPEATPVSSAPKPSPQMVVGKPSTPTGDGGCGVPVSRVGETELVVDLGGLERRAHRVYIPREYDPAVKHPLLVVFRDVPETQRIIQRFGLDELADEKSVVILVPEDGALGPWMTDTPMRRAVVGIEDVIEEFCIDRSRIFGFGHGAGGRGAEKLPCYFDRMTATATSSFRPQPDEEKACDRPTPHLHIATLKDRASRPEGGRGCGNEDAIPVAEQDRRRRAIGRCGSNKTLWEQHKHGSCWTWDCDVDYVTCHVDGGREWPGVRRVDHAFVPTQCDGEPVDFPFRDTIWRFFEEASK